MRKIRFQEIVQHYAKVAGGFKGSVAYEIIVPVLDFNPDNFDLDSTGLVMFKNGDRHAYKLKCAGRRFTADFYILGDFYDYAGKKNNRYEIARHLEKYDKLYMTIFYEDNARFGFTYYIRNIDDPKTYEKELRARWAA